MRTSHSFSAKLPNARSLAALKKAGAAGLFAVAILVLPLKASAGLGPTIEILRHSPCNLFAPDEPVRLEIRLKGFAPASGEVTVRAKEYDGKKVWEKVYPLELSSGEPRSLQVDMGKLGRGYYWLKAAAHFQGSDGKPRDAEVYGSAGVMEFCDRTAAEVRNGGYRFGLKWWGGLKSQREAEEAMVKLGLQWTRILISEGTGAKAEKEGRLSARQILTEFPMNAVIKIERFPQDLFDEARYGPLADWEAKYGKGAWTLKTLPKKEGYQKYLREQLATIPPEQQVFEIWNEPWDKMSPEDFATISQWIAEVVLKERPNAILGPNLLGNTSDYEYDGRVIKAGGLKGMKMVALHPYAASENREWFRGYRKWLNQAVGRDMEIYITEFGSHSTPQGPAKRTEQEQAERVVRQSLSLYAEGVSAFMPHWIGQTEANPTYIEDWFGFLRKTEQPKPVLLAYANCARLIDASNYIGDLWYGPRIEAMLFERKGGYVLALWTLREAGSADSKPVEKEVEIDPGVEKVTLVNMIGQEKKLSASAGKVRVILGEAPIYLVGVSSDLAKQASKELRPDRWPKPAKLPRNSRTIHKMTAAPRLDGSLEQWKSMTSVGLLNPKVSGEDASGIAYLGWDDGFLYLTVDMRDNELLNVQPRAKLYRQDSIELFFTTQARESGSGFGPQDHHYFLAPTSGEGRPIFGEVTDPASGKVEDVSGAKYFAGKTSKGWIFQAALPLSGFPGFDPSKANAALEIRVNDADSSHERFKIDAVDNAEGAFDPSNPSTWSLLKLQD